MSDFDPEAVFSAHLDRYFKILEPLFVPADPISNDIIRYFASLLRVLGMEDGGWDPYLESENILNDLNRLMKIKLAKRKFPSPEATMWRLGLLLYCHIVEMDAPYEVITNLLRFRVGKGYSPNPYFDLLTDKEKKNFSKVGIRTRRKIEIIKGLSREAGIDVGSIYDEFYNGKLRNSVQHSDFILAEKGFRSRSGISGGNAFSMTWEELDDTITRAKAFIAAFFKAEMLARQLWGMRKQQAIPYDAFYKGLMEVLVDERDVMTGFTVHWPNNSQSTYRRTDDKITMTNCMVDLNNATISLWVDRYAVRPGQFSPLWPAAGLSDTRLS